MSNKELVYSPETIQVFLENMFPSFEKHEAIYISLSTRTKYLSEEDRETYSLSKNEMFHRRFLTEKQILSGDVVKYLYGIRTITGTDGRVYLTEFTDKRGNLLPLAATTVYININPVDLQRAALSLQSEISKMMLRDLSEEDIDFSSVPSLFSTAVQKSRSQRRWIDLDFDFVTGLKPRHWNFLSAIGSELEASQVLDTRSGYHVILDPKFLREEKINLGAVLDRFREGYGYSASEIGINRNAMVPLPGTYQAGQKVEWI